MVSANAVVRFPVSSVVALALMACVFQALYVTVMQPQTFAARSVEPIEFTPLIVDHPASPIDRSRPPLPKPIELPPLPTVHGRSPGPSIGPGIIPPGPIGPVTTPQQRGVSGVAKPIVRIEPEYPRRALAAGIEGWVRVQFTVSAAGTVTDVFVVDSDPKGVFDAVATRAVQHWKYAPKVDDGRAVEMRGMQVILRFDLENAR